MFCLCLDLFLWLSQLTFHQSFIQLRPCCFFQDPKAVPEQPYRCRSIQHVFIPYSIEYPICWSNFHFLLQRAWHHLALIREGLEGKEKRQGSASEERGFPSKVEKVKGINLTSGECFIVTTTLSSVSLCVTDENRISGELGSSFFDPNTCRNMLHNLWRLFDILFSLIFTFIKKHYRCKGIYISRWITYSHDFLVLTIMAP